MAVGSERSEAWFRALMEQSPLSTQVFSPDGRTIQVNRAWERLWGATIEHLADYNILEDQQLAEKGILSHIRRGFAGEATAIPAIWYDPNETLPETSTRSDPRRWVRAFIHPIKNESGEITEVVLIHEDMTDQKLAELNLQANEERLRIGEERFRVGLSSGAVTVFEQDVNLRYTWVYPTDPAFPENNIGRSDEELLPGSEGQELTRFKREVLATKRGARRVVRTTLPSEVRYYDLLVEPRRDADGNVIGVCGTALDITAQQRVEDELRATEARASSALDVAQLGTWQWDLATNEVKVDPRCREICGLKAKDNLSFHDITPLIHPGDRPRVERSLQAALRPGNAGGYAEEFRFVDEEGAVRWVVSRGTTLFDQSGRHATQMLGTVLDITSRKQAEEALRESQQRFARFMQHLPGLAWAKDLQGRYVYANDAAMTVFGTSEETLYNKTDEEVFQPEVAARFKQNDQQALASSAGVQVIETLKHGDGILHHSLVTKFPIQGSNGKPALVGGMAIDISDLHRAQAALAESELRYRTIGELVPFGTWMTDPHGNVLHISNSFLEMLGQTLDEHLHSWTARLHPDDFERVAGGLPTWFKTGHAWEEEYRIRDKEGCYRAILSRGIPIRNETDEIVCWVGINLDITERKRSEKALRDSEEQFRGIVSQSIAGVAEVDLTGRFIFVNDRYCEIVGRPRDELLELRMQDISVEEELKENLALFEKLGREGAPFIIEKRYIRPDGSAVWVNNSVSALRDSQGRVKAVVAVCVDVTDRRRAEDALREADRRKNEFLATLAHELRNPLAPIRNSLQLLQLAGDDPEMQEQARSIMERQLQQMVRLIDDLLDISRITRNRLDLRKERIEIATIVQSAMEATRPFIESFGHELVITLPAEPVYLHADLTRLAQVVSNLLNNAAKYTNRGGRISLTARRLGGEVVLSVKDNGIGIAPEHLSGLFERFSQVTTALERAHGGLGIGLALVRGLVEMHGGQVEARSKGLGHGSEFVIRLPVLAESTVRKQLASETSKPAAPAKCRILVVDDNKDSAATLTMMLRLTGHETHSARDGLEAVEAAGWFYPDVVLLDIGMPKLNGYEAAARIRRQPWGKKMVLVAMTGWGQEDDKQRAKHAGFDHHLTKPLDYNKLKGILAAVQPAADS